MGILAVAALTTGCLWKPCSGLPGPALPGATCRTYLAIGTANFVRFSRWSKAGVFDRLFAAMADEPDFEYILIDSTIVRAHQHAAGKKGGLKLVRSAARAAA